MLSLQLSVSTPTDPSLNSTTLDLPLHLTFAVHCVAAGAVHKHANKKGEGEVRLDKPETFLCCALWDPTPGCHAAGPQWWLHTGALWADAGKTLCVSFKMHLNSNYFKHLVFRFSDTKSVTLNCWPHEILLYGSCDRTHLNMHSYTLSFALIKMLNWISESDSPGVWIINS